MLIKIAWMTWPMNIVTKLNFNIIKMVTGRRTEESIALEQEDAKYTCECGKINQLGSYLAIHGGEAWVKYDDTPIGTGYASVRVATLSKPLTPKENLRDKLIAAMDNSNTAFQYANYLSEAIINGEIEGLEYKPQ